MKAGSAPCERMNFSAAASSSSVVTPARAFDSSIFRQRTRMSPADGHLLDLLGGLADDHPIHARRHRARRLRLLQAHGRQGSADLLLTSSGGAVAVDPAQQTLAGRSTRPAARSWRGMVEPLAITSGLSSSRTISSLPSRSQTPSCSGGLNSTWKTWPFSSQVRRPPSRRTTSSSETSISRTAETARPSFSSLRVECLGLGIVRGSRRG